MHPIAPYARTAYAQGFAAAAGPLTERVRAGCLAAVQMAVADPDNPRVLEVALHLGHLEGTWAAIYQRRDRLHVTNQDQVAAAFNALGLTGDVGELVTAVRQHLGLVERRDDGVAGWVGALVRRLFAHRVTPAAVHRLREALRGALLRGRAEGRAGALALAAAEHGTVGFSFDLAFTDAYRALSHATDLLGDAETDGWLSTLLGDVADGLGGRLSALAAAGAPYEDMTAAATDLLDGSTSRAAQIVVDMLSTRALSQGALDLYATEGVGQVDFLDAGDNRVCPRCTDAAANSPYTLADAPKPGLHPFCRCTLAPNLAATQPSAALVNRYLDAGT